MCACGGVQLFLAGCLCVALHIESKSLPGCCGRAWQAGPRRREPCMLSRWRIAALASYTPYRTKRGRTLALSYHCIRLEYAVPSGAPSSQDLTFEAVEVRPADGSGSLQKLWASSPQSSLEIRWREWQLEQAWLALLELVPQPCGCARRFTTSRPARIRLRGSLPLPTALHGGERDVPENQGVPGSRPGLATSVL